MVSRDGDRAPVVAGAGAVAGFVPDRRVRKWRRPSTAVERSRLLVAVSVPEGSVLAGRVGSWLEAVRYVLEEAGVRADHAARGLAVARGLVSWVDARSRTTRVTNDQVVAALARTGVVVSVRTVQRWVRRLESWGLLGLVAQGRSAAWAPRACVDDGRGGTRLVRRNEAAVRSLLVPRWVLPRLACGSRCHPYPLSGNPVPRTRARGTASGGGAEPLRGPAPAGDVQRPPGGVDGLAADRRRAWWSARRTRSTEEAVLGLARRLQEVLVVLRGCSDRYVMRVIREFWEVGWGLGDLVGAVDTRPDGSAWPHGGARGVREPARWLAHRLGAWLDTAGQPLEAPSAARARAHERVLAERAREEAARRETAHRVEAQRAAGGGVLPGQALARREAARAAASVRRCRGWSPRSWTGVTGPGHSTGRR